MICLILFLNFGHFFALNQPPFLPKVNNQGAQRRIQRMKCRQVYLKKYIFGTVLNGRILKGVANQVLQDMLQKHLVQSYFPICFW